MRYLGLIEKYRKFLTEELENVFISGVDTDGKVKIEE